MQSQHIRSGQGTRDVITDLKGVSSWTLARPVDLVDSIVGGAYSSKLMEHDMFFKTVQTSEFDYTEDWEKSFHT